MAINKQKVTTAVVAGVTAVALVLGGTFAWTSIQQEARNEAVVDINPGGRLHDDFDGRNLATAGSFANKDVYVENFGDNETGVPIFARVRLTEYMEIGQQAGNKTITDGTKKADSLIEGRDINDLTNWDVYKYGETTAFSEYWSWTLGDDGTENDLPYYLPTFNKNKDSLTADINGTYEGSVDGDIVHYDDFILYGPGGVSSVTGTEVYDHDSNTEEETGDERTVTNDRTQPIDDYSVYEALNVEHTAVQMTQTSTVISMEEYKALSDEEKTNNAYWVFDTDGWAYWSKPIAPGATTGLLLDGITMSRVPDDNWYYSINVKGQFATASDLSAFTDMSSDAAALFAEISDSKTTLSIEGFDGITQGTSQTYKATAKKLGVVMETQPAITWTALDADGTEITDVSFGDGSLTVSDIVEEGTVIILTASTDDGEAVASKTVTVYSKYTERTMLLDNNEVDVYPHTSTTNGMEVLHYYVGEDAERANRVYEFHSSSPINWTQTLASASSGDSSMRSGVTIAPLSDYSAIFTMTGDKFDSKDGCSDTPHLGKPANWFRIVTVNSETFTITFIGADAPTEDTTE